MEQTLGTDGSVGELPRWVGVTQLPAATPKLSSEDSCLAVPASKMGSARNRRERLPAAARRRQLLDVALECFATSGYHATSLSEIAAAAGVTKPVLYQHFHSKRELFSELLEAVGNDLLTAVVAAAEAETSPYRKVRAGFEAYFRFVAQHPSAFWLLFGGNLSRLEEFSGTVGRVERGIAEAVARFIEADIDREWRELLGLAIVGLAEVTGRRWVATQVEAKAPLSQDTADRYTQALADLVWAGLRGLPGAGTTAGAHDWPGPSELAQDIGP